KSAYGEVIPACSRVILDEAHQLEDIATNYFGIGVSTHRIEDLARDVERFEATAVSEPNLRVELTKGIERLRDHGRRFFNDLAFAHKGQGRIRSEERMRVTDHSLAEAADAGAHLSGALEILESTLALARLKPRATDADEDDPSRDTEEEVAEQLTALVRR